MSNDYADPHGIDRPDPTVLGERVTGSTETVVPERDNPAVASKVAKAVRKRGASQAPTGGVYVAYNDGLAVQVFSSEIAALRYASEQGFKVRKVAYGTDL